MKKTQKIKVAYQGVPGAYSYEALLKYFKNKAEPVGFATFQEAIEATENKKTDFAFLPIENATAGRVAFMHQLLPKSKLKIVGEYFFLVEHQLLAQKGAKMKDIKRVYSHPQALAQSSEFIKKHKLQEVPFGDTSAAAAYISKGADPKGAAIASATAGALYGLQTVRANIHHRKDNYTRFIILTKENKEIQKNACKKNCITSVFYQTRNIPAALFKSLSGFATEGINIIKLESFVPMFNSKAEFYLEFEGEPTQEGVKRALSELEFYSSYFKVLGTYKKDKIRCK